MVDSPRKKPRKVRIVPYKETHQQGVISIDHLPSVSLADADLGVQIASDGRVWICINRVSVIRFRPRLISEES